MTTDNRREQIIARFTEPGINVPLVIDETMAVDWIPPGLDQVLTVNPTRMVEITETLDDETFGAYLDAIEFMNNEHVKRIATPLDERIRYVEEKLYDEAPGSLMVHSAVQMAAL